MKIFKSLLLLLIPASLPAQPATWELVRSNLYGKIAIDPSNPEIIYVCPGSIQYGLHKSMDSGKAWVYYDIEYGIEQGGIVIEPNNPQRLWIYGGPFKGLVRSEDGGMTAVRSDSGIAFDHHGYSVLSFAYDSKRNILYAADYAIPFGGIYQSIDKGRRWQQLHRYSDGLPFISNFLWVDEDSGWVYACSNTDGIWRSKDSVLTWRQILTGSPTSFVAKVPNSRTMYATASFGHIYKSYDMGDHWITITPAIMDSSVLTGGLLVSSLDTNYVFIGASGGSDDLGWQGGFFMSSDGGENWELYLQGLPQYELWRYLVRSIAQSPESKYIYISLLGATPLEHSVYRLSQSLLTSVHERTLNPMPSNFVLRQNYPNPFNSQTRVEFSISTKSLVTLSVYSVSGEHLTNLFNGQKVAGNHFVTWNGKDSKGGDVSSGIYLVRLQVGQETLLCKMLLIR